ncbi:MAG: cobalamin-binding protein [Ignavibacteriales bacterium]|nr:cobalamin-binding protein [Ignavibacteriales bacterium]MBK7980767.1 cobalamin-binding protein [Ignavibacteriota bacterium]
MIIKFYVKQSILFLLFFVLLSCNENPETNVNKSFILDDLGKTFEPKSKIERIVSLAPNLTELLFTLKVGNKIVGNTKYCNYPDSAKSIEKVGDLLTVDAEKIVTLKPDIIFITVEGNSKFDYDKLKQLGFNVFVSNPKNFKGIKKTLKDMSKILDREKYADSLIENWDLRIAKVKETHKVIVAETALFLVSTNPIFTVGKNSFINEIITFAGLKNIAADKDINYPLLNREEILKRDPDYIILYETNTNKFDELLKVYPEWNTLKAVVNKRIFFINADLYSRPGPRFVDAVENLNKMILKN